MKPRFVPPYPAPHGTKLSLFKRFLRGWNSWIHMLFEKSYTMKLGEVRTPALDFYIANELPLVERIMVDEWRDFPKHRFLQESLDPLVGNSVFSVNGEEWREQREMIDPAFSHTALRTVFPLMSAAVDDLIMQIRKSELTSAVRIDPFMTHVAGDIIYRTLFTKVLGDKEAATIYRAFQGYQRRAQSVSMLRLYKLPTLGFQRASIDAARRIHAVFEPIVRARYDAYRAGRENTYSDILSTMLSARHPAGGAPFSFEQLMEQITFIFLAGHETSASAMTWALYILACCPDLQEVIRNEARAALKSGTLDFEALKQLPQTRNLFRETLRLYPPVSFFVREVTRPTRMRDKDLKPDAMMVVSPWLIQRNCEHWPDPHAFDPSRFDQPEMRHACQHAYMPFGKGPRICIGAGFAQQEALLVIARIVDAFTLEALPNHTPEPVSRLTLRPKHGVRLRLRLA